MSVRNVPQLPMRFLIAGVLALWAADRPAAGQDAEKPAPEARSAVRDEAGMFGVEAVKKAKARLRKVEQTYHVPTVVETVDSVGGTIDAAARKREQGLHFEGVFILISKRDHKLVVRVSPRPGAALDREAGVTISEVLHKEFVKQDFDRGLERAAEEIETLLAERNPARGADADTPSEALVLRNQVRLTLGGARTIIAGAEAKARALKLNVNIAVVDDGGHLIAFERMDGARPASGYTATTKAVTAATFRAPSGPLPPGTSSPDPLLNLSLQNAAAASGGKLTTLYGGVPVVVDGQVIAGVGVGGGTGEQDAQVARAGIERFLAGLKEKED